MPRSDRKTVNQKVLVRTFYFEIGPNNRRKLDDAGTIKCRTSGEAWEELMAKARGRPCRLMQSEQRPLISGGYATVHGQVIAYSDGDQQHPPPQGVTHQTVASRRDLITDMEARLDLYSDDQWAIITAAVEKANRKLMRELRKNQ